MDAPFPAELMPCIEEFFQSEHSRVPGSDVYPDVFSTPLFFPLQRQTELAIMMREARKLNPKVIYEIGADKGGGLYHWCKSLTTVSRVIACEIRGLPYRYLFEAAFPHIEFLWIEGSSYDSATVDSVQSWLGGDSIDCLFIDGDKGAFHVDFDSYRPCMSEPGIVFMHDIQDEAPGNSYRSVCNRGYRCKDVIDISDTTSALQREQANLASHSPHEAWLRYWNGRSCGVGVIYVEEPGE